MRARTIVTMSVLALGSTLAGPAAYAGPHRAPATCAGNSCYGKDPQATGCAADGSRIGLPAGNSQEWVEFKYSGNCHAAWAKIHGQPGTHGFVQNNLGQFAGVEIRTGSDAYSLMVNDDSGVQAVACVFTSSGRACTQPY
jgi:hypothetical protein